MSAAWLQKLDKRSGHRPVKTKKMSLCGSSSQSSANMPALFSQFVGPPQPAQRYIVVRWRGGLDPSVPSSVCAEELLRSSVNTITKTLRAQSGGRGLTRR